MASLNDLVTDTRNAARPNSAKVSSSRSSGGATLVCDNLSGWPTASKVHFVTYQIDSSSNPVAGTQLDAVGIVSGNSIASFTVKDGTDSGNAVNDVVEMLPTAAWGQDLATALVTEHDRTGKHTNITASSINTSGAATIGGNATVGGTLGVTGVLTPTGGIATTATTAAVATSETTTSTSYADLTTTTDSVTVTVGANGLALVTLLAQIANNTANAFNYVSFVVSGANTVAVSDINAIIYQAYSGNATAQIGNAVLLSGLSPGSTTFKMKYKVATGGSGSGTGTFLNRKIAVVPL